VMLIVLGTRAMIQTTQAGRPRPAGSHAPETEVDSFPRPLLVGMVHGLAGSGALTALVLSTLPTVPSRLAFVALFGAASTLSMAAASGLLGWPLARLGTRHIVTRTLTLAVGVGSATITATCETIDGTAAITVTVAPVAFVSVTPPAATIAPTDTQQLTATTLDGDENVLEGRTVTWESDDEEIATVDEDGLVTAVADGVATITAISETIEGTATITVLTEAPDVDPDLLTAIAATQARETSGAIQYLHDAYTGETPEELDAAIRTVGDRAQSGAVTYTPAALAEYLEDNG